MVLLSAILSFMVVKSSLAKMLANCDDFDGEPHESKRYGNGVACFLINTVIVSR